MMETQPPRDEFKAVALEYYAHMRRRVGEAISGVYFKHALSDHTPGLSDVDLRVTYDAARAPDPLAFSFESCDAYLETLGDSRLRAGLQEHSPNYPFTEDEFARVCAYEPAAGEWEWVCGEERADASGVEAIRRANLAKIPLGPALSVMAQTFLVRCGHNRKDLDAPNNFEPAAMEVYWPYATVSHYLAPVLALGLSVIEGRFIHGKRAALEAGRERYPDEPLFDEIEQLRSGGWRLAGDGALEAFEARVEAFLARVKEEFRAAEFARRDAAGDGAYRARCAVCMEAAQARAQPGIYEYWRKAPAFFEAAILIEWRKFYYRKGLQAVLQAYGEDADPAAREDLSRVRALRDKLTGTDLVALREVTTELVAPVQRLVDRVFA